ncbi:phospholipid scramblase [Chloropicon primus]|nr:phospholipid scramblase [Chloropicon primus]
MALLVRLGRGRFVSRAATRMPDLTSVGSTTGLGGFKLWGSLFGFLSRQGVQNEKPVDTMAREYSSGMSREKKQARLQRAKMRRGRRVTPPSPSRSGGGGGLARRGVETSLAERNDTRDDDLVRDTGELSLDQQALIVTREIEMFNVFLGFEQKNRYTLRDSRGLVAGYVEEEGEGIGKVISRQILRTRRPLTANIFDSRGSLLYRIYRPFYFISSTIIIEDGSGGVLGEVRQRWHLFKRNYDLYLGKGQFGEIKGNFLAWEFEITDEAGGTLALIDRNFSGFGIELFTDAGKYVIHFGGDSKGRKMVEGHGTGPATQIGHPWTSTSTNVTAMAKSRTNVEVQDEQYNAIKVARPLSMAERAITLAAVISIDFDYFSRHSGSHGIGGGGTPMPWFFPFPGIFGGGSEDVDAAGSGEAAPPGDLGEGGADGDEGGWFGNDDGDGDGDGGSWLGDWDLDDFD